MPAKRRERQRPGRPDLYARTHARTRPFGCGTKREYIEPYCGVSEYRLLSATGLAPLSAPLGAPVVRVCRQCAAAAVETCETSSCTTPISCSLVTGPVIFSVSNLRCDGGGMLVAQSCIAFRICYLEYSCSQTAFYCHAVSHTVWYSSHAAVLRVPSVLTVAVPPHDCGTVSTVWSNLLTVLLCLPVNMSTDSTVAINSE
jgi:hypothetical protein